MIITNEYNLPQAIYNAVNVKDKVFSPNRYSVTEIISPPQLVYLQRLHWKDLKEDCSQRLWALLGQSIHHFLSLHNSDNSLSEEKLEVMIDGIVLTGRIDLWDDNMIDDYKCTSVYAFLLGEKEEWVNQLNAYAFLFRCAGFPVEKLKIHAILRDWQRGKSYENNNYPFIPFQTIEISLWTFEKQEEFLEYRLADLKKESPRPCTPAEKWTRPTTFAVKKDGRKTALRVLNTINDAQRWIDMECKKGDGNIYIEERKGEDVRCNDYCIVRGFCPQYKEAYDSFKKS